MTSRDFGFLTLRNTIAYQPNGDPVPANNIFITSSSGEAIFSDTATINILNTSTINTDILNASIINISTINASTINASTISSDLFNVSTLNASTIIIDDITTSTINLLNLNTSSIFTSSIFTNYLTTNSTAAISTLNATNMNASTLNLLSLTTSSIFTNYLTTNSTAAISTLNTLNLTISSSGGINTNNSNSTIIGGAGGNIQLYGNEIYASTNLNITGTAISRVSIATIIMDPGQNWLNLFGKYCFVDGGTVPTLTLPTNPIPLDGAIIIIRNTGTSAITAGYAVDNIGNSTFAGKTSSYVYVTGIVPNGWYAL